VDQRIALNDLRLELLARLVGVDRLCSAAWYSNTRRRSGSSEMSDRYATKMVTRMAPSTITNQPVPLDRQQLRDQSGRDLEEDDGEPIATANAKMSAPRESSVETSAGSSPSFTSSCAA